MKYVFTIIAVVLLSGCVMQFDKPLAQMTDAEIIADLKYNTTEDTICRAAAKSIKLGGFPRVQKRMHHLIKAEVKARGLHDYTIAHRKYKSFGFKFATDAYANC
jgi:inorganic pyrophosphatase/exopolyphosphatase